MAAYRSTLGAALSLGDPVGPAERRRQAAAEFGERMRRQGQGGRLCGGAAGRAARLSPAGICRVGGWARSGGGPGAVLRADGQVAGNPPLRSVTGVERPPVRTTSAATPAGTHAGARVRKRGLVVAARPAASASLDWDGSRAPTWKRHRWPCCVTRPGRIVAFVNEAPCFRSGGTAHRPDAPPARLCAGRDDSPDGVRAHGRARARAARAKSRDSPFRERGGRRPRPQPAYGARPVASRRAGIHRARICSASRPSSNPLGSPAT